MCSRKGNLMRYYVLLIKRNHNLTHLGKVRECVYQIDRFLLKLTLVSFTFNHAN